METILTFTFDIVLYCDVCGNQIKGEFTGGNHEIHIQPCKDCLTTEYENGYTIGRQSNANDR